MEKALNFLPQKIIEVSFYLLLFLIPLVLTPLNYELFEYNKMMLTYGLTAIITASWIIKMIVQKRVIIRRTPLDLPLILFLLSQIVSTFISMDRHVSIWGYYSRFNGGLLSIVSYFLLYYAFVSNFPREKVKKLLTIALISGVLVSIYGILEHFGIDKDIWVQDVQNRVFSTLGQPNWLAAYLVVLIPFVIGLAILPFMSLRGPRRGGGRGNLAGDCFVPDGTVGTRNDKKRISLLAYWLIGLLFYITLIFTKSRSGFLGFWVAYIIFLSLLITQKLKAIQIHAIAEKYMVLWKIIVTFSFTFLGITFLFGAPFDQINRFTLPHLFNNQKSTVNNQQLPRPTGGSVIDVGITESGTIRRIVWQGAVDIFRSYPLFGTGVETFAFSYYKFRPAEHNMTSEWDFLYNKAHNEYLNYAATTGAFGLGSYLLIILVFIGWNVNRIKNYELRIEPVLRDSYFLILGLFSAWISILITNFFGFSVVIIQLFFFLIPAISFVLSDNSNMRLNLNADRYGNLKISNYQIAIITPVLLTTVYILLTLSRLWYADVLFAEGYQRQRLSDVTGSYQSMKKALEINDREPFYYDEFSYPAAQIAVAADTEKEATLSASLTREAVIASNFAVETAPQNVNFWKTRTRVFYVLSQLDEAYFKDALYALEKAEILSPTDPKVKYNLALLYDRMGKEEEAIKKLLEATRLKPDYRDAFFAQAYFYEKAGQRNKAKESLQYILEKIATDDAEAKMKLEELR